MKLSYNFHLKGDLDLERMITLAAALATLLYALLLMSPGGGWDYF